MRELVYEIRPADEADIAYWAKSGREPTLATMMLRHCYRVAVRDYEARTLLVHGQRLLTIGLVREWSGQLAGIVGEIWAFVSPLEVMRRHARVLARAMPEIRNDADIAIRYRRVTALVDQGHVTAPAFAWHFGFRPREGAAPLVVAGGRYCPWDLDFSKEQADVEVHEEHGRAVQRTGRGSERRRAG